MRVYLKSTLEMWTTNKRHRDGRNANEKLFLKKKVLIQMFQQEFGDAALLKPSLISPVRSADISDNLGL